MKVKKNKSLIQICPVRNVISRIGDKWSILILLTLNDNGILRYSQLNREIPDISQKMLANTLKSLEADKLIIRKVYPEVPPRVEYRLTDIGKSLIPHIIALTNWANENMKEIVKNRNKKNKPEN
ncbi:MAG: helix-turn-helix transcriptional regulator [Bacteroidales bacterium]|jgi:DNA-binding HxlR family transcriptional regulator|nr:helix-turn-helix transcriptional regulator [Bacteroidales bacterium]